MILNKLIEKELIDPPSWVVSNCCYLTLCGSMSYGTNIEGKSDYDYYGFCIPPKHILFPWLDGKIWGFDEFEIPKPWHVNHIKEEDKEYDFTIYNINQYFALLTDCNPNIIDSLFTPQHCVAHCTKAGQMLRDNRKMFLHKGAYQRFRGYAYQQFHKMET